MGIGFSSIITKVIKEDGIAVNSDGVNKNFHYIYIMNEKLNLDH